jgi:hypothetical protein
MRDVNKHIYKAVKYLLKYWTWYKEHSSGRPAVERKHSWSKVEKLLLIQTYTSQMPYVYPIHNYLPACVSKEY